MNKWHIKDFCYFADIWFVVGTETELAEWTKRVFPKDGEQRGFTGRHIFVEPMEHYILLPLDGQPTIWQEAALAHEVLHLTFSVLNNAGIYHSSDSEEAFNYYFQAMFAAMLKKILK